MQEPNYEAISADANSNENTEEEMVKEIDESTDGIVDAGTTMEENKSMNDAGSNIVVENSLDEIIPEGAHGDIDEDTDNMVNQTVTRSGRISKLHDYAKYFPDASYSQIEDAEEGRWLKPQYYDDHEMVEKLSEVIFYRDSCFTEGVIKKR